MASCLGARRRATVWLFIALLLGEHAFAVRETAGISAELALEDWEDDGVHTTREGLNAVGFREMELIKKAYVEGEASEAKLSCPHIQERIANATRQVTKDLHLVCIEGWCDFTKLNVDEVLVGQGTIISLVESADRRKCLPMVMGSQEVQQRLTELLSFVGSVLHAAPTQEGRARVQETYLQLVSFQEGVLSLEKGLVDRQNLLGFFRVQEDNCPSPCQTCDHREASGFGFRCLLKGRDKTRLPELGGHRVTCEPPKRRWFRWTPFSRQCHVSDWKEAALQHVHVSAMLTCASITMLRGMNALTSQPQRREMHRVCLKMEQGYALTSAEEAQYKAQLLASDSVVPPGLKLAVNTLVTYGLASGLAGLRAATRGNERAPAALLEVHEPQDFSAAFAPALATGEVPLIVRALDRAMYGDPELLSRAETLRKLDLCEDIYSLKAQKTFTEGVAPLVVMAMTIRSSEVGGALIEEEVTSDAPIVSQVGGMTWGQIIFGSVVGGYFALAYATAVTGAFWYLSISTVALETSGLLVLAGLGWLAALGLGVYGIFYLSYYLFGLIFKSPLRAMEQRLDQCLAG